MMKKLIYTTYPIFINVYTVVVLYLMFFAFWRGYYSQVESIHLEIRPWPFQSIQYLLDVESNFWTLFKNIVGNIVMFIPYGFLGLLYPKLNRFWLLFLTFFLIINFLEFLQYFTYRGYAEFDDVLLNSTGMILGFLLYRKFFILNSSSPIKSKS